MVFTLPSDVRDRPVAGVGAGTLGRRIASVYVAGGTDVRLHDVSEAQLYACVRSVAETVDKVQVVLDVHPTGGIGTLTTHDERADAVRDAWMVIEAVPED